MRNLISQLVKFQHSLNFVNYLAKLIYDFKFAEIISQGSAKSNSNNILDISSIPRPEHSILLDELLTRKMHHHILEILALLLLLLSPLPVRTNRYKIALIAEECSTY